VKTLTRYVLIEFIVPLFYCLTGFLSIYVLFDLFGSFSRMNKAQIDFATALRYFCGYLAPFFHYIVPAALLLATLYTMWMFCRHSEITAMRASGISFFTIVKPLLSVAFVMALAVMWVNEEYVPENSHWAAQMKTYQFDQKEFRMADNIVFRNTPSSRTWNIERMLDREGKKLGKVKVTVDRPNGGARKLNIEAEGAEYLDGEWWFMKPRIQHYDAAGQETKSLTPELDSLTIRCFDDFEETPRDFIMQNRPWKYNSILDRFRYLKMHTDLSSESRRDCLYDTWAQIMSPWACIIITLFAIPAGIASGRQSVFKGILGALGMFFAFYTFDILMMILAKNGLVPVIPAAVAPCVLFLALGIRSFYKQR